jgi:hypothetical protein
MYAVKFITEAAYAGELKKLIIEAGQVCWIVKRTGEDYSIDSANLCETPPKNIKLWFEKECADNFMKKWKPYPWYYIPAKWTVVEVKKLFKVRKVHVGFKEVKEKEKEHVEKDDVYVDINEHLDSLCPGARRVCLPSPE